MTIFRKSEKGQRAYSLPASDPAFDEFQPDENTLRQSPLPLPEVSELNLTRHFIELSRKNIGIDNCPILLGSCTMKLNPRVNELVASFPSFTKTHPLAPVETVQGNLTLIYDLIHRLCQLTGMTDGTLTPCAGAQGEFVGLAMIKKYQKEKGEGDRNEVLVPDSAHGTNPATAHLAGYKVVSVRSDETGDISLDDLKNKLSDKTAALMLTNPNTLGLFSPSILIISKLVHEVGGLLYYDGANLNAIATIAYPAEMGFDVMHLNLHKTFSTPHGGGGPGSGPVLCTKRLSPYLPGPKVIKKGDHFDIEWKQETSIGQVVPFFGNFLITLRAYLYLLLHGEKGLRRISEGAVLNANYLKKRLSDLFTIPFRGPCMHEFVIQGDRFLDRGIRAFDIAKRLLDFGIHSPTMYFPLIIKEALLIEPTESESKKSLDHIAEIFASVVKECLERPEVVKEAPHTTTLSRLDEVRAVKNPILKESL